MRKIWIFLSLLFLSTLLLSACGTKAAPQPTESAPTPSGFVSEGVVLPVKSVDLAFFPNGGVIASVSKQSGDQVNAGDVIASLVLTPQLEASQASAERELLLAQNTLQDFLDQAEVKKTQAAYDLALAKESFNDASDKKRDKEHTYKYSKTRESKVELDKALTNYDLTQAQVALAEVELARWENGPDPIQLNELKSRVANAESQLNSTKAAASTQLELVAPWDGTVITNDLVIGQTVAAGIESVRLADESSWKVETTDLKETYVANLNVGDKATITIDALSGKEFEGTITQIEGYGVDKQGDITYKVVLSLNPDPAFKWNMTANIQFK